LNGSTDIMEIDKPRAGGKIPGTTFLFIGLEILPDADLTFEIVYMKLYNK